MSTISDAARNAARDAINALLTSGSAVSYPTLRVRDSSNNVLLSIDLNATTPFGAASAGVATANAPVSGGGSWATFSQAPSQDGLADHAVYCDRDNTVIETLSVGATGSGEEFELSNLNLVTTSNVTMTTAPTVTALASYDPTP